MKYKLLLITLLVCGIGWGQIISQYVETNSGSTPKGIEIWNNTGSTLNFSTNNLIIQQGTNGAAVSTVVTINNGTLDSGGVIVIGTSDIGTYLTGQGLTGLFTSYNFSFNGDDALVVKYGSTTTDIFGMPGSDPGTSWLGSGVNTANQNIELISGITSGASTGWTDPSLRFSTISTLPSTLPEGLAGFGIPPTSTTTWNGTTWSNGDPTSSVDAIIDGIFSSSGNFICKDLTVNAGATLTINAADKLSVMGDLVNNGSIIFKSNNTSTGRFDSYSGDPITGTGTVTMERYIDGKRAFRLLAPGVTTSGAIANNWQQQVFITGSTTGADGFDATTSGAASMFTFENLGWTPIANTDQLSLNALTGYRILIRGDRTPSILTSQSNGNMNTPVTLTATGTMVTGNVSYNTLTGQEYTLVANPYISPINWATVTKTDVSNTYYAWDPNLGTGNQRGRFVSCDVAGTTSILVNSGSQNTDVNQYIQPGQAFFIQKSASGVNGSITVKESDKAATFTDVFRTAAPTAMNAAIEGKLGINLYESVAHSLGEYPIDGAVAISGPSFDTNAANDGANKIMSHGEQVAFVRENIQLGVEKVSPPQLNDELAIATINLVPNKNYVWRVVLQDNFSNEDAYLYDTYTQSYHALLAANTTVVSFETTAATASTNTNRFKIVFQNTTLAADDFLKNIKIYPNPAKAGASFYVAGITEGTVSVFNVVGQNIPVRVMSQGNAIQVTPTATLSQGIYLVSVTTTDGKTAQVKWIVE